MRKPDPGEYPAAYQKYFDLLPAGSFSEILQRNSVGTTDFFKAIPAERHDYRYAEGKWSVKEVLMHMIDTERVFSYRALAAARGDETPVYRMDEELYARNVDVSSRTMESLLAEFGVVRKSSEYLFQNLTESQTRQNCNVVPNPMSVRAIGYFLIAHVMHHTGVLKERYLDSDNPA